MSSMLNLSFNFFDRFLFTSYLTFAGDLLFLNGVKNVVKEMSGKTRLQPKAIDTLLKLVLNMVKINTFKRRA